MERMRSATIIALSACTLAGCATINNDRTTVGGQPLTALDESVVAPFQEATGPSVIGPDRSNWDEVTMVVAVDTTQHHPNLTDGGPAYAKVTPRQRGEFPGPDDALDLGAGTDDQVAEMFVAPFAAGLDVVLAIPRLIANGGKVQTSPRRWYERGSEGVDAPALEPATAPVGGGTGQ